MEIYKTSDDVFVGKQIIYTPHFIQDGGTDTASYIKVSPVKVGSKVNGRKTPYWKFFYRAAGTTNVGYATAKIGSPALDTNSVLNNCIGTAQGRFGEIFAEIADTAVDFHAGKGFDGSVTCGANMPGKPTYTYDVASASNVKKIMPGTIFCYINDSTGGIHAATVEEILAVDANGLPTKVSTSSGHYGSEKYITRENVCYNGGKWTVGAYRCFGYIFNPVVRQYTFPGDIYGKLDAIQYKSGAGLKTGVSYKYNASTAKGFSILINFTTSDDVLHRSLLFGNYKDSTTSAISLELQSGKVRGYIYNANNKKVFDKKCPEVIKPNTNYTAKLSIYENKVYFGLINTNNEFISESFDVTNCDFKDFCFFKDNRTATTTFETFCDIKYCVIYSNWQPKAVFVPISLDGKAGMYDLQNSKDYLSSGITGYIGKKPLSTSGDSTSQINELNSKITELSKTIDNLTSANNLLTSEKIDLAAKVDTLTTKNNNLSNNNKTLTEKLNKALLFDVDGDGKRTEADGVYLIKNIIDPNKYPIK